MKLDPEERIIGETYKCWRELFAIHPAAEKMPRPTAEEFELLKADIAANGLKNPVEFLIVGDQDKARSWLVLDGISRLDALGLLGYTFAFSHGGPLFKPPAGQSLSTAIHRGPKPVAPRPLSTLSAATSCGSISTASKSAT